MKAKNRLLRLSMVCCFIFGWAVYLPVIAPNTVYATDPPPPTEEIEPVSPGDSPTSAVQNQEASDVSAALEALEAARHQGPAAVMALLDTLRGPGLDIVMDDIHAAQAQLARSAAPLPEGKPVSLAEEEARLQEGRSQDAVQRAQALTLHRDPAEGQGLGRDFQVPQNREPNAPVADRTVGNGCTYATIAAAIAAADPGDRLLIEGGVTFVENLIINKNLTLQGGYAGCASGNTDRTTLDGNASNSVVQVNPSLTVSLENLNLTNGNSGFEGGGIVFALSPGTGSLQLTNISIYANLSAWGGGLWVGQDAEVIGENVQIYNNTATAYGGGVRLFGGRISLSNSNIYGNSAPYGGGVYATQQGGYNPSIDLPTYADVYQNTATTGAGLGGGIYLREGTVLAADCSDIYYNDAIEGGGAYLITSTLTIQGDCSEIMLNTATGNGGGVYAQGSTINMDLDAELYSNSAGTSGGGAYLDNSDLWGDKASIWYNTADYDGGGVYATNTSLLDMDLGGYACSGPRCSRLSNNTANISVGYGGGVSARSSSEVDLRQIFIENNSAYLGGAVYAFQSPVYLYNDLVAYNNASGNVGDGLRLNASSLSGEHNTIAHNDAGGATTGHAIDMASGATLALQNAIVWGHASSINDLAQTVSCSDVQGGYAGTDNLNIDPQFVDPASVNFHLQSLSPVMDRCAAGQSSDFDNEPRPVIYIRPATPYDMGADEVAGRVGINRAGCVYGHIQDAVDAANLGDTLQAVADVFPEVVTLNDKDLTIEGGYDVDCTTFITGTTTLDASSLAPDSVFYILNSKIMLRNLNITGGNASTGGGVSVYPGTSQVTLDNTEVFGNQATYGGGLYIDVGNVLTITNDSDVHHNTAISMGGGARVWGSLVGDDWASSIHDNSAPNGGGVAVPGGVLDLHSSHVQDNHATDPTGRGGGIYVYSGGVVTMTHSSNLAENDAYDGAGIYADASSVHLEAVVHSNSASHNGGGVYLATGSSLTATGTYIGYPGAGWGSNQAVLGGGIYADASTVDFDGMITNNIASSSGGGVYANASTITLTNTDVYENQAALHGGAMAVYTSQLTVEANDVGCDPLASPCSTLHDNTADSDANDTGDGGAIYANQSTLQVNDSYLYSNSGFYGGAIFQDGASASAQVNNTLIYSNTTTVGIGAGIRASGGSFTMMHVTLAHNLNGAAYSQPVAGVSSMAFNSIAWGNTGGGFLRTFVDYECNIDQEGNIGFSQNPQFVSPGPGEDYHLQWGSPARDACVTGLAHDLDRLPRPVGLSYDMGAYEYPYGLAFTPNLSDVSPSPGVMLYTHTLTNTGSLADSYTLTAHSSNGWSATLDPAAPIALDVGQSSAITVSLTIPADVLNGTLDSLVITATSSADPGLTMVVTDTTSISTVNLVYLPLVMKPH
jgi:hypothetical protein